ncbi:hypothetical protein [Streptomyces sp. NRRL S-350]|uniref:hypothetical protein n=1 Tax=Streptomyces sp. NRRL S-350 TaxID=1463902 RepID=UPI0004C07C22|nr:hypothetical protein [Streptomyces sp. NRRL S-350]
MTEIPEPRKAELRIPKAALDALAAAVQVRTVATVKDDGGLDWYYPVGTRDQDHVEFALMPGGEEVFLRMSSRREETLVVTIEQWYELVGHITPPGPAH